MRVKSECLKSPEYVAGVSEQFSDKIVTNFDCFSVDKRGAECRLLIPTGYGCNDALDCGAPTQHWTEEPVTGTGVGSGVHLLPILLVFENDSDILSVVQELRIGV
jgi:hypothetical protein